MRICFDYLLQRFFDSGGYRLPADIEAYLETDDVHLMGVLRASANPFARRVVQRKPYRLLLETHDFGESANQPAFDEELTAAKIDFFRVYSKGILSKYFKKKEKFYPLLVVEPEIGRVRRIEEYTSLYRRFDEVVGVSRVYCRPEDLEGARRVLGALGGMTPKNLQRS